MFKKLLAVVGVGGAKVDTVVTGGDLQPGGPIKGVVVVKGGDVDQTIEGLRIRLMTEVEVEVGDNKMRQGHVLAEWPIRFAGVLPAGEERRMPFEATLPWETPVTVIPGIPRGVKVWLQTGLAIDDAVDASDRDELRILPLPVMRHVMAAIEAAGFRPMSADVEKGQLRGRGFQSTLGCYQEIEFRPIGFSKAWRFNEIELSFVARPDQLHLVIEVDRSFARDSFQSISLPHTASAEQVRDQVGHVLR